MTNHDVSNRYFNWLCGIVCKSGDSKFSLLLNYLHDVDFKYLNPMDQNRAEDGIELRWRFASAHYSNPNTVLACLDRPCTVLEMIVALAIKCEETIMDDPRYGDRTGQWFWNMIVNLGLGSMTNSRFNRREADRIIDRFMNLEYEPDGRGGLFYIRNCEYDLRDVEIFYQLCWYLDNIV